MIGNLSSGYPMVDHRGRSRAWLVAALHTAAAWYERYRQRRALAALSDTMLKDIGISRAEAFRETDKPFWRA